MNDETVRVNHINASAWLGDLDIGRLWLCPAVDAPIIHFVIRFFIRHIGGYLCKPFVENVFQPVFYFGCAK